MNSGQYPPPNGWQPPQQPQQPFYQQDWQQPPYNQQPPYQPGQYKSQPYPQPTKRSNPWQWYKSKGRFAKLGLGCGSLIIVLMLCVCSLAAYGSTLPPQKTVQPTPTTYNALGQTVSTATTDASPTDQPTLSPSPTATPTDTSTPKPTPSPTPKPTPRPTARPNPTPTPRPCGNAGCNAWNYDFTSGNLIYYPPGSFCSYFACIASFYGSDDPGDGYVVQCVDGQYSQSGGESGSCSHHGGNGRTLYSH